MNENLVVYLGKPESSEEEASEIRVCNAPQLMTVMII